MVYSGYIGQGPARLGRSPSHQDGMSPIAVDRREAVLIGHIIAQEDRNAACKGRFLQELLDCLSLVGAGGAQLDDGLSRNCHEGRGGLFSQRQCEPLRLLTTLGSAAEVQGQATRLSF